MNTCIKCGCEDAYPSLPPCPTPEGCPNPQPCAEFFDANCVIYTGPDIKAGNDVVVNQDDTLAEALANLTSYFHQEIVDLTTYVNNKFAIIDGRLTTIEGDIVDIKGDIVDIQGDITNIQGDITNIQGDIADIQGDITNIEGDIGDIQGDITNITSLLGEAMPVGSVIPWAGQSSLPLPNGWLPCDGSLQSTTVYAALFAVINDEYGTGAPIGQFYMPNLIDAIPYGNNQASVGTPVGDNTQTGTVTVGISAANLPQHSHPLGPNAAVGGGEHKHLAYGRESGTDVGETNGGVNINRGNFSVLNTGIINQNDGSHTHTFSGSVENAGTPGTTQATGTITGGENRQRGISMRYMIKY